VASLSLSKLPWWGQLLVFVVLSAAIAGGFYYYVEMPRQEQLAVQRKELAGLQARIAQGRDYARRLDEFKAQVAKDELRLESLKPILPDEKDAGDLLRRIQTLAVQSSLTIRGFRPQAVNTHEMYAEWPIGLELEGTYHNLGAFLDSVSKFPRIINIGALVVNAKPEDELTSTGSINVTCVATTFVLVDQTAAPPDTTKKGAPAKKTPPAAKTE
jgi:type IV pilus assembly protein PilO